MPDETSETHYPKFLSPFLMDSIETSETHSIYSEIIPSAIEKKFGVLPPHSLIPSTLVDQSNPTPMNVSHATSSENLFDVLHGAPCALDSNMLESPINYFSRATSPKKDDPDNSNDSLIVVYKRGVSMHARLNKGVLGGNNDESIILPEALDGIHDKQMLPAVAHTAARLGKHSIFQLPLFQLGSDLMFPNGRGDTPLHVAARAGQLDIVEGLIHLTEVGLKNNKGNTALHEALEYKHEQVARLFVESHTLLFYSPNNEGKTPEYLAAEAGFLKLLEHLWKKAGDDFIHPQCEAMTALHAAIIRRHPDEQIQELLDYSGMSLGGSVGEETDPNFVPVSSWSSQDVSISMAAADSSSRASASSRGAKSYRGCLELVLKHKPQLIRVTDSKGRNPLHYAASIGNYEVLNKLLEKDTQAALAAYQPDIFGHYPIHEAASAGHIKAIRLLLELCPNSWALPGKGGQSILHVGVQSGKENVVRYILKTQEFETLINDLDANGDTPLHLATEGSHFKVVRVLTSDNRVNMSICNNDNLTALDIAERNIAKGGSLRRVLTLATLRIANAPRARNLDLLGDHEDRKVYIMPLPKAKDFKERVNTLLLVSTLVATVTFAGGFTIPGGLTSDGMATMLTNSKFKAFVICDAIALFCSILAVVSLIWAKIGDVSVIRSVISFTVSLLGISLSMMVIAFSVGLYIVTSRLHWLAGAVCIMGAIFLICILIVLLPLQMPLLTRYRILQRISYGIFFLLALVIGANSDEDDDIRKDYVWKERKERKRKTRKEKKGKEQHQSSAC